MDCKKTNDRWTDEEVQALLCIYAEEDIKREFESATRNDKVYAKISARLSESNIQHSGKQVRDKIKKLKQDYKKIRDHNSRGGDRRSGKWYDRLDALLGHRPAVSGSSAAKDSATLLLEANMCEELARTDEQIQGQTVNGGGESDTEARASMFAASSPRHVVSEEARPGKRKRDWDYFFLDSLREMEEANRAALLHANEQRDRNMQLMLEAQAQETELRRQELDFLQADAAEGRRLQRDFQDGFLAVLGQLVHKLSHQNPTDQPFH